MYIITMQWGRVVLQWDIEAMAPHVAYTISMHSEKYAEMRVAHGEPERVTIEQGVPVGVEVEK